MRQRKTGMFNDATTSAWLVLMVATGLGWWLGQAGQTSSQGMALATAGVIVVAFIKVWIVGFQFMELRHAPRWLRHAFDAWIVAVCVALLVICLR
jgi:Na+-translocating ferredoxin:NAD+ oxidoreductase RnfA subunit